MLVTGLNKVGSLYCEINDRLVLIWGGTFKGTFLNCGIIYGLERSVSLSGMRGSTERTGGGVGFLEA